MNRDESVYLRHIVDAIDASRNTSAGIDEQSFCDRPLVQDGVIRQLEIIGEAVKHFRPPFVSNIRTFPGKTLPETRDNLMPSRILALVSMKCG